MVGSHLSDYILSNEVDCKLFGAARWRSPLTNLDVSFALARSKENVELELIHMDLTDPLGVDYALSKIPHLDCIYHLAAQSYPHVSFHSPLETLNVNINGTFALLSAILKYHPTAKIHVCSSSEVFGRVPKDLVPISEDTPFHPASPYAISKVGTDLISTYFSEAYDLNVFTTRMFTHTGPRRGDVFHESTFAKQIALIEIGAISDYTIRVGNLKSLRTYADVRDAVVAYKLLMDSPNSKGQIYNIGGSYTCEVGATLQTLINQSSCAQDINILVEQCRLRPIDADLQIPDISKLTDAVDWSPKYTFNDTMKDLLSYWRNRVSMTSPASLLVR